MEYTEAKRGRIFVARIDDGEDIIAELKNIIIKENIKAALVQLIGASSKSKAVLGPHKKEYPPNPYWWEFDDAREILATGIMAWDEDEPKLNLHSGIGHHNEAKIGCIRTESTVYITIEAVIQEIIAPGLSRKPDERYNASLLSLK